MGPRRAAAAVLTGIALTDLAFRVAQVALPLVVIAATGGAAQAGLVAGTAGVPTLLSPWWARWLRDRVRSGRAIAACYLGEAAGLACVPTAAWLGRLDWRLMLGAGLLIGVCEALDGPGRDALLADLGDRCGPDRAFGFLTTRDLFRRIGMVVGPAVGGLAVGAGHTLALLWAEVAAVVVAAGLTAAAAGGGPTGALVSAREAPRILAVVRERPDVLAGWVIRGTGCFGWFAFSLGLAVLGVERGRPGFYVAVAMTAYGVGSVLGTPLALRLVRDVPVVPAAAGAWALTGVCWVVMGVRPIAVVVAVAAFVSAVAVVVGNAAVTASITRSSRGRDRTALLAGQSVVVNASSAGGLLVGGSVIAMLGPPATLVVAGTAVAAVAAAVGAVARAWRPARSTQGPLVGSLATDIL